MASKESKGKPKQPSSSCSGSTSEYKKRGMNATNRMCPSTHRHQCGSAEQALAAFKPGQKWSYRGDGTVSIAGAAVRHVTGSSYLPLKSFWAAAHNGSNSESALNLYSQRVGGASYSGGCGACNTSPCSDTTVPCCSLCSLICRCSSWKPELLSLASFPPSACN